MSYAGRFKKTEAGQGGRVGHGNMAHHDFTEVIKKRSNRLRRKISKELIRNAICNYTD